MVRCSHVPEVGQQGGPKAGGYALGMELHSIQGKLPVREAHEDVSMVPAAPLWSSSWCML